MNLYTLDQLRVANLPTPQPIAEGLLNEGETILLVGRPKVGGRSLANFHVPRARRVLLIDLENGPAGVRARFAAMLNLFSRGTNCRREARPKPSKLCF